MDYSSVLKVFDALVAQGRITFNQYKLESVVDRGFKVTHHMIIVGIGSKADHKG